MSNFDLMEKPASNEERLKTP